MLDSRLSYYNFYIFFSRLLQMGVYNAEIYNNLGLCCFYAQQYDMALNCFTRALSLASDDNMADIWYNISHIAIVSKKLYFEVIMGLKLCPTKIWYSSGIIYFNKNDFI